MTVNDGKFALEIQRLHDLLSALEKTFHMELEAHEKLDVLRHVSENNALQIASLDVDRRLEEMNKFREQLNIERSEYVNRREHDLLSDRIKMLEIARGEQTGKAAAYASLAAFIGTGAAVILHFWK